jgi:RHH-type rel operon transcriptional repressor/antitoxin RelB
MLAVRLAADTEKRLDKLAKKTGKNKSDFVRQAILAYIDDIEDFHEAVHVLKKANKFYSSEEVSKMLDLDD